MKTGEAPVGRHQIGDQMDVGLIWSNDVNQNSFVVRNAIAFRTVCSRRSDGRTTSTPKCSWPNAAGKAPDRASVRYRSVFLIQVLSGSVARSISTKSGRIAAP